MISCTKDGVEFSASGDVGRAKITVRQNACADKEEEQVCVCVYNVSLHKVPP